MANHHAGFGEGVTVLLAIGITYSTLFGVIPVPPLLLVVSVTCDTSEKCISFMCDLTFDLEYITLSRFRQQHQSA